MEEDSKPPFPVPANSAGQVSKGDSKLFGLSMRGLIVLMVVLTVCGMSISGKKIEEPLYTLVGLTVGYYFGQNQRPQKP